VTVVVVVVVVVVAVIVVVFERKRLLSVEESKMESNQSMLNSLAILV
jgi:hypothetical protein